MADLASRKAANFIDSHRKSFRREAVNRNAGRMALDAHLTTINTSNDVATRLELKQQVASETSKKDLTARNVWSNS